MLTLYAKIQETLYENCVAVDGGPERFELSIFRIQV